MTNEQGPQFENLNFNPFNFDSILLNKGHDPDENLSESFEDCSYSTPSELKVLLEKLPTRNQHFSVISFNIRSLKKNFEEFKDFITDLEYKFSVISLSETWCLDDPRNESLYKLNNYTCVHQARSGERSGGGTCLFIHSSLSFQKRSDLSVNNNDIESLSIEIINKNKKNIIVNVTYRQPAGNTNVFEDSFKNILSTKKDSKKSIYITGDLNLNLLDYKTNAKVKSYLNLIFSHNFIPLINKPTRISKNNATIIDHILTNTFNNDYKSGIVKTDISDHFPVFIITDAELNKTHKTDFIFKREINSVNLSKFKESLLTINWNDLHSFTDPNIAYDEFLKIFSAHYDSFFPKKKIQIKSKNITSPWITKGIVKSSKRKQKLYDKYLKRKTPQNDLIYKNYRRLFETIKRKSKRNYYNERLDKYQNNIKKTWDIIKEVIGNIKSNSKNLPTRLNVNNVEITGEKLVATNFNRYFVNVGPKLAASINTPNKKFENFLSGNYGILDECSLRDEEIKFAFEALKPNKSPGFDDISSDVVKFAFDALVHPIKHIFDLSLTTGIFPDKL